jgi:hypothetical protein
MFLQGVVEGFYGRAWSHATRLQLLPILARLHANTYLYCPKSDPYLRRRWGEHWPQREWDELSQLASQCPGHALAFGVGLSPFALYQRYDAQARATLRRKIEHLNDLSAPVLAVLFDDMPGDCPDLAARQGEIVADIASWTNSQQLLVCPTYYSFDPVLARHFGEPPPYYWRDLGRALPDSVAVMWTGNTVCADSIVPGDLDAVAQELARPLVLWDNYPVNDGAKRSNHLFCYAPPERSSDLRGAVAGHLLNPMNQAHLSLPAIAGLAALYGADECDESCLASIMGESTWDSLRCDRAKFRDLGLSGLGQQQCAELARRYAALDSPAGAEVAAWLRGEYTFDPACLTD